MSEDTLPEGQTLEGRYSQLESHRATYLERAREASKLTIPQVFPPQTSNKVKLKTPFQSIGAMAVNSLCAKTLLSVFPASQSFFRLDIDEMTIKNMLAKADSMGQAGPGFAATQAKTWTEGLAKIERTINKHMEASTLRAKLAELLKQLIIGGNSLLFLETPQKVRVFRLDSYVVQLDAMGNLIEIVVKERVHKLTLSQAIRDTCETPYTKGVDEEVDVYTGVTLLENGRYAVSQEINNIMVPGSAGDYPKDKLPWLPLRWSASDGDSYSYSYVEQYLGDLQSLEGLSKAIIQGAAAAAKVVFLVKAGGTTSKRALQGAPNGAFIDGNPTDVATLQLDKYHDFRVASDAAKAIEDRLRYAFLMTSSIQRNGERVTAEEIRTLATELEDQLGGIYSILSQSLQLPLVNIVIAAMEAAGTIPQLPKGLTQISITTGLDALGRSGDADRLSQFKADIMDLPGAVTAIRLETLVSRFAIARGIDTDDLIKTADEMAQEQKQAQMQEFMQKAGTAVAPDVVNAGMAQGAQQGEQPPAPQ